MWCGSHLQDGPIEAQQDVPRLVPNTVQAVGEAAQKELVAQTTPGTQTDSEYDIDICVCVIKLWIHQCIEEKHQN